MKSKLIKDKLFIQSYGTYTNELFVIVGIHNKKEIFKFCKKEKVKADCTKWILENIEDWNKDIKDKNKGQVCWDDITHCVVLMLRTPEDTWDYWEVLMHECHHIVQNLAERKNMLREPEAQAYLQEFLFHSLRRKLQGVDSVDL